MLIRHRFFNHLPTTSSLGFGTPAFMAIDSAAGRERLFDRLVDQGVTHFDTARYYGYGQAERIVGQLIRTRRNALSVTTKFGIQPPQLLRSGAVQTIGRYVLGRLPRLRAILSRQAQAATTRGSFTPAEARQSLEESLRALATPYIDLVLLHEPTRSDALSDDLVAFLQDRVAAGDIRAFGCGGAFAEIKAIAQDPARRYEYLQFEDNPRCPNRTELASDRRALTFGSIGRLPVDLAARFQSDPETLRRTNDRVGIDCASASTIAKLLVRAAVERNSGGVTLFSARTTHHVDEVVSAMNIPAAPAMTFWALTRDELLGAPAETSPSR